MTVSISALKASDGTGNASVATVSTPRSSGATTLVVDTVQDIPTNFYATMGTPHTFSDPVTGEDITIISEATAVDFKGHVDGANIEIDVIAPGYVDNGSAVGDIIIIKPTTQWADAMAESLEVVHDDDGKLKANAPITGDYDLSVLVNGWITAGETWTYASALTYTNTNTTRGGTFTISGDKTSKYSVGMKIKFTQSTGGTKYGCIVAISYSSPNTTVTVFLGTDYTLNNEAISSPYYSMVDTPHGFPKDPTKWTLQTLSTTQRSTTSTSWVSLTDSLSTPPGAFNLQLLASVMVLVAANVHRSMSLSLSSDASTPESDFIAIPGYTDNVTNDRTGGAINLSKPIFVSAATTWTVIGKMNSSSSEGYVANGGADGPTVIRATCLYAI